MRLTREQVTDSIGRPLRRSMRRLAERCASTALQNHALRAFAFDLLHLLTDSASVTIEGVSYTFSTNDWIIGRSLYISGGWDDEFLKAAVDLLGTGAPERQVDGGIVVDVGANIGTTTMRMVTRYGAAQVVAIEPSPRCLPYLRSNIAANRRTEQCIVVEAAASDSEGTVAFLAGGDNSGGGEVIMTGGKGDYLVPCRKLDDILEEINVPLDRVAMIWVDAEGHEFRVLQGAERALKSGIPFVIEFWPQRLHENGDYERLVDFLDGRIERIVDLRAHAQQSRSAIVEPTMVGLNARANELGPWPTDLLLLPTPKT